MAQDIDSTGKRGRPEGSGFLDKPVLISFQVSEDLKLALKSMAVGETISQLIRRICEEAVKKHEANESKPSGE